VNVIKALLLSLIALASTAARADAYTLPKVRAVTAFVRLDRTTTDAQIDGALRVLRETRAELQKQGYEVQTIRIVTQPLPELVAGSYGPFFPGTHHTGAGKNLSIGFQAANIVQEVFAQTHGDFRKLGHRADAPTDDSRQGGGVSG
jgi:hypothetical protein